MTAEFIDSNVAVYAVGVPSAKQQKAEEILQGGIIMSSQVVSETMSVLLKKQKLAAYAVHEIALAMLDLCEVVPVSALTIRKAIDLRTRFNFSHWDSQIVAAAVLSGCDTLYSEDLRDGLVVDGLTIVNPFKN